MYRELGNNEKAIRCGLSAIEILERIGDPYVTRMQTQIKEWQEGPKKEIEYRVEDDPLMKHQLEVSKRYELELNEWKCLPWWRNLITRKPVFPIELTR